MKIVDNKVVNEIDDVNLSFVSDRDVQKQMLDIRNSLTSILARGSFGEKTAAKLEQAAGIMQRTVQQFTAGSKELKNARENKERQVRGRATERSSRNVGSRQELGGTVGNI